MRQRTASGPRPAARPSMISVDVVVLTPQLSGLAVLLVRGRGHGARSRWTLPWDGPHPDETLDAAALRIARFRLTSDPAPLEQLATWGDARRHPGNARVSVGYMGLVPALAPASAPEPQPQPQPQPDGESSAWVSLSDLPVLAPRHRAIIDAATAALPERVDHSPLAFRLLPALFTLTELQGVYELLLGRRLHKASFRRALLGAHLVEAIDEWRSEGRGRPAQLFRYAPRKRRGGRRGVRFDLAAAAG